MKHAAAKSNANILNKIETIEKDVMKSKLTVLNKLASSGKKILKLKGILKDTSFSDKDITTAKKSLYSKTGI